MVEANLRLIEALRKLDVKIKKSALRTAYARRLHMKQKKWTNVRNGNSGFLPTCLERSGGSRLRGFAVSRSATTLNRWEGLAWAHHEDGSAIRAKAAEHRGDVDHQRKRTQGMLRRSVACADA